MNTYEYIWILCIYIYIISYIYHKPEFFSATFKKANWAGYLRRGPLIRSKIRWFIPKRRTYSGEEILSTVQLGVALRNQQKYPLVNIQKTMERSTIFNGKTHYFYGHFQ